MITRVLPIITIIVFSGTLFNGSNQSKIEADLIQSLLKNYSVDATPNASPSERLQVTFGLYIKSILELDTAKGILHTVLWLDQRWIDSSLVWKPSYYGEIKEINLATDKIWVPDMMELESMNEEFDNLRHHTKVRVANNGSCRWYPGGVFKTACNVDLSWYPYDTHTCKLMFASWVYGKVINLTPKARRPIMFNSKSNSPEWIIKGLAFEQTNIDGALSVLNFEVELARKSFHTRLQVFFPPAILSILTMPIHFLPVQSKERVTLGIIQLALLAGSWYQVSRAVNHAFLVTFADVFYCTMFFGSFITFLLNVFVVNLYYKDTLMPSWVKSMINFFANLHCKTFREKFSGQFHNEEETSDTAPIEPSEAFPNQKKDWIMLSQQVDRISIIIYLIWFILSCVGIFGTIPPSRL